MRKDCLKNRSRKAQQLIEFALVVPILMMFLFIIIEVGMAINARMTLSEAVKSALVEVNNLNTIGGGTTAADKTSKVKEYIESQVRAYLIHHNIPNSGSVSAKIVVNDNFAAVLVNYEYNPVFVLPGMGNLIPSTYHFSSSQTLNPHIFKSNVFPTSSSSSYRTTEDLSKYYYNSSGNFINAGELVENIARPYTAFLVHMYDLYPNFEDYNYARLISWEGYDLLPPNLRINLKTGTLEVRSPYYITDMTKPWVDTQIPYIWTVSALGINHLIYVKYNTEKIKILDTAGLYYKLRLNNTNVLYNLGIPTCAQVSATACDDDLNASSTIRNTINAKALRFNPRIGSETSWNDEYIIGTTEPVKIIPPATWFPPTLPHPYQQINSYYFSYTKDYENWDENFLVTISTPFVKGLKAFAATPDPMQESIYNSDIADSTKNPFFKPFEYRFKLCESNPEDYDCVPGTYQGPADASEEGNIDANKSAGWDDVETTKDSVYVVDIFDVIIDSDGDGIPDAWDKDPSYFDVNVNGILDGNEINPALFKTNNRCNDEAGSPYDYETDDPDFCGDFPLTPTSSDPADYTFINIETGTSSPFYFAPPFNVNKTPNPVQTDLTSRIYIPTVNMMDLYLYNPVGNPAIGQALYYKTTSTPPDSYTRKYPTWHDPVVLGCTETSGSFSSGCITARRNKKSNSGYLHITLSGNLQRSNELNALTDFGGRFYSTNRVTPTPRYVW